MLLSSLCCHSRYHCCRVQHRKDRISCRLFPQIPRAHPQGLRMGPLLSTSPVIKEVDSEEVAVEEGLEQGEALCQQVGLSLSRVLSIEEIIDDEPAPEADK